MFVRARRVAWISMRALRPVPQRVSSRLLRGFLHCLSRFIGVALTFLGKTLRFVRVASLVCLRRALAMIRGHLMVSGRFAMRLGVLLMRLLSCLHVCSLHVDFLKAAWRP
jgi:hypothetical protein